MQRYASTPFVQLAPKPWKVERATPSIPTASGSEEELLYKIAVNLDAPTVVLVHGSREEAEDLARCLQTEASCPTAIEFRPVIKQLKQERAYEYSDEYWEVSWPGVPPIRATWPASGS